MADPMQIGEIVSLDDTELSSGIVDGFIGSDGDEVDSFDEASVVVVHMIEGPYRGEYVTLDACEFARGYLH